MNFDLVEKIAATVLYEGYMLYPYRRSSIKNQQRWNFGVLYPQALGEPQAVPEAFSMQTECLVEAAAQTRIEVKVRFLQIVERSIGRLRTAGQPVEENAEPDITLVDRLELNGRVYLPWQEAVERELEYCALDPASLSFSPPFRFTIPAGQRVEYLHDEHGTAVGVIVRKWDRLDGSVEFKGERCRDGIVKITVAIANLATQDSLRSPDREAQLKQSLVSTHTILGVEQGRFLSLLEPPPGLGDFAAECKNTGTWPVLVGNEGETVLSSPIILYDHPQIAPESAGNLFDSTEIDEILSLRILTLTEDEKREMRESDERSREILERTEAMPEEQFMKLHGVLRGLTPVGAKLDREDTQ